VAQLNKTYRTRYSVGVFLSVTTTKQDIQLHKDDIPGGIWDSRWFRTDYPSHNCRDLL